MTWVVVNKDFTYDDNLGQVVLGQIFELGAHRNDQGLIRHKLLAELDPQPKSAKALEDMPKCGECGRVFLEEWQRDRCGASHELSDVERGLERQKKVQKTYDERVLEVGT